jgi:hypothetical protein
MPFPPLQIGRYLFLTALCALSALPATGGLVWKSTVVQAAYAPEDKKATAQFPFKNEGAEEAVIRSVESSCSCTTAHLDKKKVAPGEEGVISATFSVGNRTGLQRKTIAVSEKGKGEPTLLMLEVQIPEPVHLSRNSLIWRPGTADQSKDLIATPQLGIRIGDISAANSAFEVKTQTGKDGVLTFTVRPMHDQAAAKGSLRIPYSGRAKGALSIPLEVLELRR